MNIRLSSNLRVNIWNSYGCRCICSVNIGLSYNISMNVGFSSDFFMNIGLSFNLLMNIRFSLNLFMNIGFSFNLLMNIRLSFNLFMNIGFSLYFFMNVRQSFNTFMNIWDCCNIFMNIGHSSNLSMNVRFSERRTLGSIVIGVDSNGYRGNSKWCRGSGGNGGISNRGCNCVSVCNWRGCGYGVDWCRGRRSSGTTCVSCWG